MFWRGLMKEGRFRPDRMFSLKFHRRHALLLAELRAALEQPESAV